MNRIARKKIVQHIATIEHRLTFTVDIFIILPTIVPQDPFVQLFAQFLHFVGCIGEEWLLKPFQQFRRSEKVGNATSPCGWLTLFRWLMKENEWQVSVSKVNFCRVHYSHGGCLYPDLLCLPAKLIRILLRARHLTLSGKSVEHEGKEERMECECECE